MQHRYTLILFVSLALFLAGCAPGSGSFILTSREANQPLAAHPAAAAPAEQSTKSHALEPGGAGGSSEALLDCPVTRPQDPAYSPPLPFPPEAPYAGEFWYGTDALWTMLRTDGTWRQLPHNQAGYVQKLVFWRQGYNWQSEPEPEIVVSGRRLDAPSAPLIASKGTNGFHDLLKSFMLVGVEIPTLGCWEITGRYGSRQLSFVVRVIL